ncbi:MAG: PHP domain-containing protein, partial [Asgard group archaeon]|nr:PHP domain-containing protein [Asgard group archaeon]
MRYVSLHNHSTFSIYDALGYPSDSIDFIIHNAQEDSMAYALTDHGNANGFGYLYSKQKQLEKKGIPFKVIYGCEFYFIPSIEEWKIIKEEQKEEKKKKKEKSEIIIEDEEESRKVLDPVKRRHHLVLFALNNEGLKNLYKLISYSFVHGFYRFPRIDLPMLEKYNKGLALSTACVSGLPAYLVK